MHAVCPWRWMPCLLGQWQAGKAEKLTRHSATGHCLFARTNPTDLYSFVDICGYGNVCEVATKWRFASGSVQPCAGEETHKKWMKHDLNLCDERNVSVFSIRHMSNKMNDWQFQEWFDRFSPSVYTISRLTSDSFCSRRLLKTTDRKVKDVNKKKKIKKKPRHTHIRQRKTADGYYETALAALMMMKYSVQLKWCCCDTNWIDS